MERIKNKIKKIIVGLIGIGLVSFFGCTSINYDTPNGIHIQYNRLGTQQMQGLRITISENGLYSVALDNQIGGENIADFLELTITTIIKNLLSISATNPVVLNNQGE